MGMKSEWVEILNQVKSGELSAEQGAELLKQMEEQPAADAGAAAAGPESAQSAAGEQAAPLPDESLRRWQSWWLYPFWAGLGVFMLGSVLMAWSYSNERFFWFACAWLPLLLGLTVLMLSAWSRTARWLHVRINDPGKAGEKSTRVAVSFPVPIHLAGWALRVFGPKIPQFKEKNLDMIGPILESLGDSREPLTVEVNDKDGEKVQVYIV
jgi:hypothetical protein